MKEEEAESASLEGGGDGDGGGDGGEASSGISEYEKQRLSRIRENRARLQALGLPHLASSLLGSQSKRKQSSENKAKKNKKKKKKGDDDDEYRPSDEDDRRGNHGGSSSVEDEDKEEEGNVMTSSGSRRKGKKRCSSNAVKVKKVSFIEKEEDELNQIDDDTALQQAIALSLGQLTEDSTILSNMGTSIHMKKEKANIQETAGRRKSKKSKSRVQLTEDEVVAYFFSFDEAGKGHISLRDLQRIVVAHDFNWTEMEVASMIHSFDSDRDGKLSLEDFQTIVSRCNMMQETDQC